MDFVRTVASCWALLLFALAAPCTPSGAVASALSLQANLGQLQEMWPKEGSRDYRDSERIADMYRRANALDREVVDAIEHLDAATACNVLLEVALVRASHDYNDPYPLVMRALTQCEGDIRQQERLADAFLRIDLPWRAYSILAPRRNTLSPFGQRVFEQTSHVLNILNEDTKYVPTSGADIEPGSVTVRLRHLLSIPEKNYSGSYTDFLEKYEIARPQVVQPEEQTQGIFGGLGIQVTREGGLVKVVSAIDDAPASKAGIEPGDLITHIDGGQVLGTSLPDAVEKLRGSVGSSVKLRIRRAGREPFDVTLTRSVIKVKTPEEAENIGPAYTRWAKDKKANIVPEADKESRLFAPQLVDLLTASATLKQPGPDVRDGKVLPKANLDGQFSREVLAILHSNLSPARLREALEPIFREGHVLQQLVQFNEHEANEIEQSEVRIDNVYHIGNRYIIVMRMMTNSTEPQVVALLSFEASNSDIIDYFYIKNYRGYTSHYVKDVDKDNVNELILVDKFGSSGLLSAFVIFPAVGKIFRLGSELYHGTIDFIDIDGEDTIEALLSYGVNERRYEDCNQCPDRRMSEFWEYDSRTQQFVLQARRKSFSDVKAATHPGLFGVSAEMTLSQDAIESERALNDLATMDLLHSPEDVIIERVKTARGIIENLMEADAYDLAASRSEEVSRILAKGRDREIVRSVWVEMRWRAASAHLHASRPENALSILEAPDFAAAAAHEKGDEEARLNLISIAAMQSARPAKAYTALAQLTATQMPSPADLGNMAWFLNTVGDYDTALQTAKSAVSAAFAEGYRSSAAMDMVIAAMAAQQLGRHEEALDWLGRGLRLTRALRSGSRTSIALMTGAQIASSLGEPELAQVLIEEAVFQTDGMTWATEGPSYLLLYGQALRAEGAPAAARASFEAALRLAMPRGGRNYSAALYELARLDLAQGKAAEAETRLEHAFAEIFTARSQITAEMHKLAFLATADDIADLYFFVLQQRQVSAEALLNAVEAWRLQVFREIYRSEPVDYSKTARTLADIQDKLAANTAYVTYHVGANASFVVLVQPHTQAVVPLAVRRDAVQKVDATIRHFLNPDNQVAGYFIRQDRIPPDLYHALRDAYDYLIDPLKLGESVERLLVASDEAITGLPWNALAAPPRGIMERLRAAIGRPTIHPAAERMAITMVPSGRLLSHHEQPAAARALLLEASAAVSREQLAAALSGLDRTVLRDLELRPLTYAKAEIEAIVAALRPRQHEIVLGLTDPTSRVAGLAARPVSTALFWELAPRSSIVHIAAHGLFNPVVPMQSIVIFDAASRQGMVRAEDLLSLNLSSNELVTLSACQTGRADLRSGGEALGFVRGLLGAGAKRVVLADWSIHDQTAKLFFEAFYHGLAEAGQAEDAFRNATNAVHKEYAHPYYWAPMRMYSFVVP